MSGDSSLSSTDNDVNEQSQQDVLTTQSINEVFRVGSLSETEQIGQVKKLCQQAAQLDDDILEKNIDVTTFTVILNNIGECETGPQLALLQLIEILTDRGIQMKSAKGLNTFCDPMRKSNLLSKLDSLLLNQKDIDLEQKLIQSEQPPYSQLIQLLIRIIFIAYKNQDIKESILQLFQQALQRNIGLLTQKKKVKKVKEDQIETQELKEQQIEFLINDINKLLILIKYLSVNNLKYFVSTNQQDTVAKLLHINCNVKECIKHVSIICTPALHDLQIHTFEALIQLTSYNVITMDYFNEKHLITQHVTSLLVAFTNIYPDGLFTSYSNPKFIYTLNSIAQFKQTHIGVDALEKNEQSVIQYRSLQCLAFVQDHGTPNIQTLLVHSGYSQSLAFALSVAGGLTETNNTEIQKSLYFLYKFISDIRDLLLKKEVYYSLDCELKEKLTNEGGIEEIEALCYQTRVNGDNQYFNSAHRVQMEILSIFKYNGLNN
ncbi:MAG: hypothetical protein EZS28_004959 [Streblomastix strix]|uniref:Uncharacterized protein n=1 Tax=Streblomastix strix TaxID=222440 RepID=A0A5J4WYU2_9EUKA|nr:MAG: hypothetical protein EZS28_004959 [Streblomastix strix]